MIPHPPGPFPFNPPRPGTRRVGRPVERRSPDHGRLSQADQRVIEQVTTSLLRTIAQTQDQAQADELSVLGHVPELACDEWTGEWHEVVPEPRRAIDAAALIALVHESRAWAAGHHLPKASRALLAGAGLVAALLTGRPPGSVACSFMTTRDVLAEMAACADRTVHRSGQDPRLKAAGLEVRGHAQVLSCGEAAGQPRYDGSLVQFCPPGTAGQQRVQAAVGWRLAAHWRPGFGRHIDEQLGAGGALRGAMNELTLRRQLMSSSPYWLGLQAAMAVLFALNPDALFSWIEDMQLLLDLADLNEAEEPQHAWSPTWAEVAAQQTALASPGRRTDHSGMPRVVFESGGGCY